MSFFSFFLFVSFMFLSFLYLSKTKQKQVYDLSTYKNTHSLEGHIGAVYTLAVSGNRFYSGSYDRFVCFIMFLYFLFAFVFLFLILSKFSKTNNSTIKVWNAENLKCLQTLVRHTSSVDALVASSNCIFSGSADHSVKIWR